MLSVFLKSKLLKQNINRTSLNAKSDHIRFFLVVCLFVCFLSTGHLQPQTLVRAGLSLSYLGCEGKDDLSVGKITAEIRVQKPRSKMRGDRPLRASQDESVEDVIRPETPISGFS